MKSTKEFLAETEANLRELSEQMSLAYIRMSQYIGTYTEDIAERFPVFPNGFTQWHETHYEVVCHLSILTDLVGSMSYDMIHSQGSGGLYELAETLTKEFEEKFKGALWDGDFFDVFTDWIEAKETEYKHSTK